MAAKHALQSYLWSDMAPPRTLPVARASDRHRAALFCRFSARITPNAELDRTLVSFQANQRVSGYNWFKYKEGFSAPMVKAFPSLE